MTVDDAQGRRRLQAMIDGYQLTQAIRVVAELGVADLLAEGPKSSGELAGAIGAHPRSLRRLLRALTSVGLFERAGDDRYGLTALSEPLRSGVAGSQRAKAIHAGEPSMWAAWGNLRHSVTTGGSAFDDVHGMSAWDYRERHEETGEIFDRAMTSGAEEVNAAVLAGYRFADARCVVDVGGGKGALMAAILAMYPHMRGVLFDRERVVNGATETLVAAGVRDRCAVVGGDFFESVPGGGDRYVLKGVLHDWSDEAAVAIMRNCRRVMDAESRLVLIERVIEDDVETSEQSGTYFMDLHMLAIYGAAERTEDDFSRIMGSAGFALGRIVATSPETGLSVIEGVPVD